MVRKGLICAAALVLALGSFAWADDSQTATSPGATAQVAAGITQVPIFADDQAAAPAPRAPLMWGLDQIGLAKPLDDMHLNISGYIEMGYFYDMTTPRDVTPAVSTPGDGIFFPGDYKNSFIFDQMDLAIERDIDASKGQFDVGFKVEGMFGTDAFYTHSDGILDNNNKHGDGPNDQLDLVQAYVDVAIPVGTGLTITAGKFVTLMGNETINPTTNAFYTHSYIFADGTPFTQTGILGAYNITSAVSLTAGITRGWNQSTSDNNGAIDFLGALAWQATKELKLTANLSEGPQSTGDNHDYWTVPEVIAAYKVSDQLNVAGDLLYGDASSIAQWYAIAGYAGYNCCKYATINLRAEYYHDGRGFTTGIGGTDINYGEFTAGVAITPLPDSNLFQSLTLRPELREDVADQAAFERGAKYSETTAALDVYWKF